MPQLKFNKDKRGYENTFVVQPVRQRGKSRSRILYWFRTPPGVRVGRAALDEEAIRLMEAGNPDLEFNWTQILTGQPLQPPEQPEPAVPPASRNRGARRRDRPGAAPAVIQREAPAQAEDESPRAAAYTRLGSKGLARLRGRYAEIMARIQARVDDPQLRDELKSAAERLNPDSWVTDSDVAAALEHYEITFSQLRERLSPRRPPADVPEAAAAPAEHDDNR